MTNWNERIRNEEARQAAEVAMQTQADQAKLTAQAALVEEENRKKQERLDALEAQVSELFTSLGAMNMLEDIRREVWGLDSKTIPVQDKGIVGSFKNILQVRRGAKITFDYDDYEGGKEPTWRKNLGSYTTYRTRYAGSIENPYDVPERHFGFYHQEGYNVTLTEHRRTTETGVYLKGEIEDSSEPNFFIYVNHGIYDSGVTQGLFTRIEHSRDFIEKSLVADCIARKNNGQLPRDLINAAQHKRTEIQRQINGNPHF